MCPDVILAPRRRAKVIGRINKLITSTKKRKIESPKGQEYGIKCEKKPEIEEEKLTSKIIKNSILESNKVSSIWEDKEILKGNKPTKFSNKIKKNTNIKTLQNFLYLKFPIFAVLKAKLNRLLKTDWKIKII